MVYLIILISGEALKSPNSLKMKIILFAYLDLFILSQDLSE